MSDTPILNESPSHACPPARSIWSGRIAWVSIDYSPSCRSVWLG